MKKIKKSIGLDKESYNLLKKKEKEMREDYDDHSMRLLSTLFEEALIFFYKNIHIFVKEKMKPDGEKIVKRQTVYISKKSNTLYNKLAFRYGYTLQELTNLIIKTIYR